MRIGLDFDNTIVCYDQAIEQMSEELLDLPRDIPRTKIEIREYLRNSGREQEWTAFQGEIYGPGMIFATPYTGAVEVMRELKLQGHSLLIISHRTRRPYAGLNHDLHKAAREWISKHLHTNGLFVEKGKVKKAYFLETRRQKLDKISALDCQLFMDDLPEVLESKDFPKKTRGILFDPNKKGERNSEYSRSVVNSWEELSSMLTRE
jgi:hypothetical protein